MFVQRDFVRDFVFPIVTVGSTKHKGELGYKSFLGTGFLIGKRGFAITASHVIGGFQKDIAAMFVSHENAWVAFLIQNIEHHPSEDVCLLKLLGGSWKSPFRMRKEWEGAWHDYLMCGYPFDVLHEDLSKMDIAHLVAPRPDLIHTKGHIRRRVSMDLKIPGVKGRNFFELSTVAGRGCSGAPVFMQTPERAWDVLGIYVGEKLNDVSTSVSFATRVDSFKDWFPSILDKTIQQEAEDYTP